MTVPAYPARGRMLRPTSKVLPEHARVHNRALLLQTLYASGRQSRADLARITGLTRVTVSDLVAELIEEGLVIEVGRRDAGVRAGVQRGKPAILLDIDRSAFAIIGVDLGDYSDFRGAVLDLGGEVIHRAAHALDGSTAGDALAKVHELINELVSRAEKPILGIGVGSPGVVDETGVVLSAPNLGWVDERLQHDLSKRFSLPVVVMNDANAAVLAEHSFGEAAGDMMLIKVGHGVGAGLLLGGVQFFGSHFAAGEIGHVVVDEGGDACSCGRSGCLETWLAAPRLDSRLGAAATSAEREAVLRDAGHRLGMVLAPIAGALDLAEIVLSGPDGYFDPVLVAAAIATISERTVAEASAAMRVSALGDDIVLRGAAAAVLSEQLGFS